MTSGVIPDLQERVARALYEAITAPVRAQRGYPLPFEEISVFHRRQLFREAEAAIRVVMEHLADGQPDQIGPASSSGLEQDTLFVL